MGFIPGKVGSGIPGGGICIDAGGNVGTGMLAVRPGSENSPGLVPGLFSTGFVG